MQTIWFKAKIIDKYTNIERILKDSQETCLPIMKNIVSWSQHLQIAVNSDNSKT